MRQSSPLFRRSFLYALLMAAFLAAPLASPCRAAQFSPVREGFLRVKNVEIKGVKVRFPIPDGYEEMQREDHPVVYDWMTEFVFREKHLPVALFINSSDKAQLKKDKRTNFRYGMAFSDDDFWDAIIFGNTMNKSVRKYFENYILELSSGINELRRKSGGIEYDWEYMHSGRKTISSFNIGNRNASGEEYKNAFTRSYIVLNSKIVAVCMYKDVYTYTDVDDLKQSTLSYLKMIDKIE